MQVPEDGSLDIPKTTLLELPLDAALYLKEKEVCATQ